MTSDKIYKLIEDNGLTLHGDIEHFAELVRADERNRTWTQEHWTEYERNIAAAEREQCAKVCEKQQELVGAEMCCVAMNCAAAIRARGEQV